VKHDFLLEIGCENIPSGYLEGALVQIESLFGGLLSDGKIPYETLYVAGTPNRLVIHVRDLAIKQEATEERVIGPPTSVALGKGGGYTKAAEGFARSQGVPVSKLVTVDTEKGEYLAVIKRIQGISTISILRKEVPRIVENLRFPKVMRWDDSGLCFARPIRWILSLVGDSALRFKIGHHLSGTVTRISPFFEAAVEVKSIKDYYRLLGKNRIILDNRERREKVRALAREAAERNGGRLVEDDDLVQIVANLLESPVPLVGRFDKSFLKLPHDVIVTALKSHQRYFSVEGRRSGKLRPIFIAFANGARKNKKAIVRGYERVLQARLADAEFYYREDTSQPLSALAAKLEGIVWLEKLGTLAEKARRIEKLALFIREQAGIGDVELDNRLRLAARLAKADLASEMVKDGKEFTLLQGYIGREYAIVSGMDREIAEAIFEHHLPRFSGDLLPVTDTGSILALADKIDTIVGCFLIGLDPTGSQDPYALRRHALGLLRIAVDRGMTISMPDLAEKSVELYRVEPPADSSPDVKVIVTLSDGEYGRAAERAREFIESRLSGMLREQGYDYDLVQAVQSASWEYPLAPFNIVGELQGMREGGDLLPFIRAMKRIVNILPGDMKGPVNRDAKIAILDALAKRDEAILGFSAALFEDPTEGLLFEKASQVGAELITILQNKGLDRSMGVLRGIVPAIDKYFDDVLVNCKDERIRDNRLSFLSSLHRAFGVFCDFSVIAGE
jgi:glycyl-tRNA synthetase beta chain